MSSPSLKHANPPVELDAQPTSPRLRLGQAQVDQAAQTTSPRLRFGMASVFLPPPTTPRLRHPHPPVEVEIQPTSPRLRLGFAPAPPNPLRLWPTPPNWDSPVVERLAWETEILTSGDQSEQRAGWRSRPGRFFAYDFALADYELPHIEAILYGLQDTAVLIPIWTDASRLAAAVEAGDTVLPLIEPTEELDLGAPTQVAILAKDYGQADFGIQDEPYEVRDVAEVTASGLVLVEGMRRDWAKGSRVVPVRAGYLPPSVTLTRPTAKGAMGSVLVELTEPGWPTLPALEADTYRGLDVLPWIPDRAPDVEENYVRVRHRRGSVGGVVVIEPRRDRPAIERGLRFVFEGRTAILQFRAFLHRCAGQRKRFWVPSFMADLELHQNAEPEDEWITIKSVRGFEEYGRPHGPKTGDFATVGEDLTAYRNPGRRDIQIIDSPGATPIRRRIQSWTKVGDGIEQLHLDGGPLGVDLIRGRVLLSWLSEQRLASDQVELRWLHDRLVETTLPMRSL